MSQRTNSANGYYQGLYLYCDFVLHLSLSLARTLYIISYFTVHIAAASSVSHVHPPHKSPSHIYTQSFISLFTHLFPLAILVLSHLLFPLLLNHPSFLGGCCPVGSLHIINLTSFLERLPPWACEALCPFTHYLWQCLMYVHNGISESFRDLPWCGHVH